MTGTKPNAPTAEDLEVVRALFDRSRTEQATALYDVLVRTDELHSSRVHCLTYRCERRCSLLDVFDAGPFGTIIGFPRYKTSPQATERTSTESGRAVNTEDGFRRWNRHAGQGSSDWDIGVNCDHLHNVILNGLDIADDYANGRTEITVRRDGSRCAVH